MSGLFSARETVAIDTPACAATARIPCLEDRSADTVISQDVTLQEASVAKAISLV
jgi:hypothetical protein